MPGVPDPNGQYLLGGKSARWVQDGMRARGDVNRPDRPNSILGDTVGTITWVPTSNVANGSYTGYIVAPQTANISASDPVEAITITSTGRTCIGKNFAEVGATPGLQPLLTLGVPVGGWLLRINTDGTPVIGTYAVGFDERDCDDEGAG